MQYNALTENFSLWPGALHFVAIAPLDLIGSNKYSKDEQTKNCFKNQQG